MFSFYISNISYHLPFLCMVSDEKSPVILILVLLLVRYFFPPLASSRFSFCLFLQFEYDIQKGFICFVCIYSLSLSFLDL